jgi:protein-ribulosamine 3-kinase
MSTLYSVVPDLVLELFRWEAYAYVADTYFFLCTFRKMTGNVPGETSGSDPGDLAGSKREKVRFTKEIAQLHRSGVLQSGKFGFPVTTYQGCLPQDTTECDTWEKSFM